MASSGGELLCNGAFGLWTRRIGCETEPLPCPVDAPTFAADRWHVRSAAPIGSAVTQLRSAEVPADSTVECSLEIRGSDGVTVPLGVAQNLEAAESPGWRDTLRFIAWCFVEHPQQRTAPVRLVIGSPHERDLFDLSVETVFQSEETRVPVNRWTRVEFLFGANRLRPLGLRVELELPAGFLAHPATRVRLADASLHRANAPTPARRSAVEEAALARRFCQRHDGRSVNAIGRALVCNPHELHFQFTFPEMRAFPGVTLPQDNAELTIFSLDGVAQSGFAYDVTYRARGSAIIRATKLDHGLRDGYLAFRGYNGAILLEAEL